MTNMGLFKKEQKPQRETFNFITRVDTVDPELKKKTLERMLELKKEQERKAAARRKAVRRGFTVAAIIALVIAVTPLRGYVASAAENVVNAIHSWMEDVFHVGMKKTDNGCTIEIIEARVANDFLYLTVDEDYSAFISENPVYNYNSDNFDGIGVFADYSGEISDDDGNCVTFISDAVNSVDADVIVTKSRNQFDEDTTIKQYKIYFPDLKKIIDSYDKQYTCSVNISPSIYNENGNKKTLAEFNFKFKIDNIDSVIVSTEYDIDYSYTLGNLKFDFQKMYVGQTESNILVELTPLNELAEYDLLENVNSSFAINCIAYKVINDSKILYNQEPEKEAIFCYDSFIYKYDSHFYIFLSTGSKECEFYNVTYNYNNIINKNDETEFRILLMEYDYISDTKAYMDYTIDFTNDSDNTNFYEDHALASMNSTNSNSTTIYIPIYDVEIINQSSISETFEDDMIFNQSFNFDFLNIDFKNISKYPDTSEDQNIYGYTHNLEMYIDISPNDNIEMNNIDNIVIYEFEFYAEKDGKQLNIISSDNYDQIQLKNGIWKGNFKQPLSIMELNCQPDKLIIGSISCDVTYNQLNQDGYDCVSYVFVNPKYYNVEKLNKMQSNLSMKIENVDNFKKNNIFTIN